MPSNAFSVSEGYKYLNGEGQTQKGRVSLLGSSGTGTEWGSIPSDRTGAQFESLLNS